MARLTVLALAGIAALPGATIAAGWSVFEWGVSRPSVVASPPFPHSGAVTDAAATASPDATALRGADAHHVTATIGRDMRGGSPAVPGGRR